MKPIAKIILIVYILGWATISFGQNRGDFIPTIYLMGKNTGEQVMLRWVPSTSGAWIMSNSKGYQVDRMVFTSEDDFMKTGYVPLTKAPLKPWPLEQWEQPALEDDYAAVAAELLYGDRSEQAEATNMFERADQFKNLFSTAMLAAEFSSTAAQGMALSYIDNDINKDKFYLYRVYSLASQPGYPIDTAYLMIGSNEITTTPAVNIEQYKEREEQVELWWDRSLHAQHFGAYMVERSVDGRNFNTITQAPFLDSPFPGSEISAQFIIFEDSVDNYVPYYYRVRGITPYGEYSEYSNVVKAMGRDRTPPSAPGNVRSSQQTDGSMKLEWDVAPESASDISGFMVAKKIGKNGEPFNLTTEPIPFNQRYFVDKSFDEVVNNWYFIAAVDSVGNASVSMPIYAGVKDSIPPSPPTGLVGSIDSTGLVSISWNLNKERDLKGYVVFFTNQDDHVFANVTNKPIYDTTFTDTVDIKVLTKAIYYKVVAVDANFNYSEDSEVLALMKPDVLPPVAPVFTDYKVSQQGIRLTWAQSSSNDVVSHQLSRREKGTENWQQLFESDSIKTYQAFLDVALEKNKTYEYKIVAVDESDLLSPVSYIITLKAIDFSQKPNVNQLTASLTGQEKKEVQLTWAYQVSGDYYFRLYRAIDGGGFTVISQLDQGERQFKDDEIRPNKKYEYTVKAVFTDGKESGFSNISSVSIE